MFRTLWGNFSRSQKVVAIVMAQVVVILILVSCLMVAFRPKTHVEVQDGGDNSIPEDSWTGMKNELWYLIQNNVEDVTRSKIDDAVIREGTYEETTEDDITTATFLLDIDSLKQTYSVTISWSNTVKLSDGLAINCPRKDEMKYPETVCYGMYNDSYSLDLYLPHDLVVSENGKEYNYGAIYEGEDVNEIDTVLLVCDENKARKLADEYIASIPIDLSGYKINYEIMSDVDCFDEYDEEDDE